jgi:hypothetical protein
MGSGSIIFEEQNMTPYKRETKRTAPGSDDSVPSVSLFDFFEEVLRTPKKKSPKQKKAATQ